MLEFNKLIKLYTENLIQEETNPVLSVDSENKRAAICAWCDRDKTATDKFEAKGYEVSHGICPTHYEEQMKQLD